MSLEIQRSVLLTCHPATPSRAVRSIGARLRVEEEVLSVSFTLEGALGRLRIPPSRSPRRAERLWQHTCFEAFISRKDGQAYHEFNFSPSGEWAVYAFRRYREAAPLPHEDLAPEITVWSSADRFQLEGVIYLDQLISGLPNAHLKLGLSAVIEEENGALSYWALKHPPEKPDFHHAVGFALEF